MKKIYTLLAATVFASGMVSPVLAHDEGHHKKATGSAYEHGSATPTQDFKGEHSMKGTISKIDHSKGTVDLKTQDGMVLTLHFPADAIKDLKEGDQAVVQMEIAKQPAPRPATTVSKK
ncbi:MAG TPA: hypothetical protein VKK81_23515 [Candidatus Binatia bacterium]|nr:hypothetical protein [Candidatus Binatia bacterium]